jgi:diguanylate cyclase (GGDEF)-like protein/PAS domain S-box-containing protein
VKKRSPTKEELLEELHKMQRHIQDLEEKGKKILSREEMYREMVHSANSIILCWKDKGVITFINTFAQNFFEYTEDEILGKKVTKTIVPKEDAAGVNLELLIQDIVAHPERYVNNENENVKKSGERVWISWTNKPIYDRDGKFLEILSVGNDITRRKKAEEELERFATLDIMTGVLNRRAGMVVLEKALNMASRFRFPVTICFLDVNNLKTVNDTIGHKEGDELIGIVCETIKSSLRASDSMCRLGGDEFLVIMPECSRQKAQQRWRSIARKFVRLNDRKDKPYPISVSHGFSEFSGHGEIPSINDFITVADEEMYRTKRSLKAAAQEKLRK